MHITFLDRLTVSKDIDMDIFRTFGTIEIYNNLTDPAEIIAACKHSDILITNKVKIRRDLLASLPQLKLICLTATGANNIDIPAARNQGIGVCNVAGYSTNSVAQHTFALLFYLLEHLPKYDQYVKSGQYADQAIFTNLEYRFWEIAGKRWGIIGLGNIGRKVADIATAFSCTVSYYSTSGIKRDENYENVSLEHLLRTSDIISIHAPLTNNSAGLLKKNELALLQPHAILLNLGRGGIVDEQALAECVRQNTIGGVGLDVLEHEPIQADNPLLDPNLSDKVILTPHMAWGSKESIATLFTEIYHNIEAFTQGKRRNRID